MDVQRLKKSREACRLTQAQAAACLRVSDGAYKNYEQGKREPNNDLLCQIADLFHVTTDYLLGRDTDELEPIDQLAEEFDMSELEQKILDNYLSLPLNMRENFMDFLYKSVHEVMDKSSS